MSNSRATRTESSLYSFMRSLRELTYQLIEPYDWIWRKINRLEQYPPIALRRHTSVLGIFDGPGYEFVAYLKLIARLEPTDSVWDVGCGCGLLELALESLGWRGTLVATDIHKPSIDWAAHTIHKRIPSFRFIHSNIYHPAYAPHGIHSSAEWLSQFQGAFDLIVAKSLLTHMLPDELDLYLKHLSQRLTERGRALLTFFVLNDAQKQWAMAGKNQIRFHTPDGSEPYAVRRPDAPTAAVAYDEKYLVARLAAFELRPTKIYPGVWTGRQDGLSFQDVWLVTR